MFSFGNKLHGGSPYVSMMILHILEGHDSATPALFLHFKDDFH